MDSFELNKIAGAILFALVAIMGINFLTEVIFAPHDDGKRGYEIAVESSGEAPAGTAEAAGPEPIAIRLTSASVDKGAKQAKKCAACHTFEQGGKNKVGPALWDVVGRAPAGVDGFSYSSAMQSYGESHNAWTFEMLDAFLAKPKNEVSGTSMGYAGMKKPNDRADLIAYLRSLSENPAPIQ
ncbi:cytochrome c family protein [Rhodobacteraceae bacterium RKSG542]|uniref:c-type cytochrome n=1 Tax=Pseudovibrio flavus TaxID=2529854 RepID=UPI0012BD653C|nr:cytochrome c family protein [Pseudovibrio flavus]MTI17881.1 cytochrome c family protein [Pseudovibrio flavus]